MCGIGQGARKKESWGKEGERRLRTRRGERLDIGIEEKEGQQGKGGMKWVEDWEWE